MRGQRNAALLAVLVFGLTGCGTSDGAPRVDGTVPAVSVATPARSPSASPTSDKEELIRQAQAAYQIAFDEFERLSWEGGADEPSAKMLEVEQDPYLEDTMFLLRDQKKRGYRAEGSRGVTKSRSAAGALKGDSDPRLTLHVCEDRRGGGVIYADGRREPSLLWEGYIYFKIVDGRVKIVDDETESVQRCSW